MISTMVVVTAVGVAWLARVPRLRARRRLAPTPRRSAGELGATVAAFATRLVRVVDPRPSSHDDVAAGVLDHLAGELRSGATLAAALGRARPPSGPWAEALAGARRELELGHGTAAATGVLRRSGEPAAEVLGAVLRLGSTEGGDLAGAVDAAATSARRRLALERELAAMSSQARASAVVMVLLPPGFLALAAVTDPRVPAFLASPPWGWACLLVGVALDVAGWLWMAWMVRRAV